ncbi:amino acid permease [Lacticaseibacillus pabuli]|uniref:Amino acid permease n=1 Tax=Lacticaseibacillus pabuli TaxID=3025672 RepID=A0ABY7WSG8_9LACO|nr:amino acid permease [Lacticaseibacillus sp. KACC 23028]WDF81906.1 amino acid permease [Lacticaseibacillus sp. KACC 23028]
MAQQAQPELARNLKSRHIQLMAIGGTIGTGLFLGAGQSIHRAGPAIVLAYLITGVICFLIMRALGELLVSNLKQRSFIESIREYVGPNWAVVTGWTYWVCWLALAMAEVTAIGVYVRNWWPALPQWLPGLVVLVVLLLLNLVSVGLFGEAEFWFSLIKVVAILALIAVGVVLLIIHQPTPYGTAKVSNLWTHGGFFPTGAGGFLLSFQMVVFAFTGIEMVGMTAGETADPGKTIPDAINKLPVRVILFYIGALLVIMTINPWTAVSPDNSPFVQVFRQVGIPYAGDIINFVVLTAAASACNSSLFSTGRMLLSLTVTSTNPRVKRLAKLSHTQVPARAIVLSTAIIAIAVILNLFLPGAVFALVSSVATVSFLFVWAMIVLAHLRFRQRHPEGSTFKAPFHPLGDIIVLLFLAAVVVIMLCTEATAVATIAAAIWIGLVYGVQRWHASHTPA